MPRLPFSQTVTGEPPRRLVIHTQGMVGVKRICSIWV
jgi:hypothetical protein